MGGTSQATAGCKGRKKFLCTVDVLDRSCRRPTCWNWEFHRNAWKQTKPRRRGQWTEDQSFGLTCDISSALNVFQRIFCKPWRTHFYITARLCCCALGIVAEIDTNRASGAKRTVCLTLSPRSLQTPATSTKVKKKKKQWNLTAYAEPNFTIKVYYCYHSIHTLSDKTHQDFPDCVCIRALTGHAKK